CRASATSAAQIGGCLVLLQIWAWERLPMTRPRGVIPFDQLVDVPYGVRWVCYHRWSDCTTHSIRAYRDQLDRLLEGELYCKADCSQRLDPGRHPDGFVPSHEVLRVHELLTECVRALGHASILDHPQDQHPYNPGHIRRRVDRRRDAPAVGVRRGGRGSRRLHVDEEDEHIPIESPPMTQDDDEEDVGDEEHIQSDTHTPSCMVEPSSSHHLEFHIIQVYVL
ncbi:unnamed protein product, partial [Cuscuta campestris]